MPNAFQKRFTNPGTFRKIRPDLLLAWLKQSESYFKQRGLNIPQDCSGFIRDAFNSGFDYDALIRVFMEPTPDIPADLVDGLHLIHETGTPRRLDALMSLAAEAGLSADIREETTPLDLALMLWLHDPKGLENLHRRSEATRSRVFEYFLMDKNPIPRFDGVSLEQQRTLERRLGAFYAAYNRGTGARVTTFCQQRLWHETSEWLFVVQHGAPIRRDEAIEMGGPVSHVWRPWVFALLKYDAARGEMGVACDTDRELDALLKIFGEVLFGRRDCFPSKAKYSLLPIVRDGRAVTACSDVPGIERVHMTAVEFYDRCEHRRTIHRAPDIFTLVENGEVAWPERLDHIASATFSVTLWRQKRGRKVTIKPSNRAIYCRDADSPLLERWFEARTLATQSP